MQGRPWKLKLSFKDRPQHVPFVAGQCARFSLETIFVEEEVDAAVVRHRKDIERQRPNTLGKTPAIGTAIGSPASGCG